MKKKEKKDKYLTKEFVLDSVWRYVMTIVVTVIFIRIFVYPERAMIKDYREKLTNNHCITRGYIYAENPRANKIFYDFVVDGIKYSGISRYSLLNPPYPEEGDSIEVYYSEKDPNINLWRGEFTE